MDTSDAFAQAIRVKACDLLKGDILFDAFGGKHPLARDARTLKNGAVSIKRTDYPAERFQADEIFTIMRPNA